MAPIFGSKVSLRRLGQTAETATALTEDDGAFLFPGVRPGRYELRVQLAGFRSLTRTLLVDGATNLGSLTLEIDPHFGPFPEPQAISIDDGFRPPPLAPWLTAPR